MDEEYEIVSLWDRIQQATLPNQVHLLCNCVDEIQKKMNTIDDLILEVTKDLPPKPDKK